MYRATAIATVLLGATITSITLAVPGVPQVSISNPDQHVRLAAAWVSTAEDFVDKNGTKVIGHHQIDAESYPYVRFISNWMSSKETLVKRRQLQQCWLPHMSFEQYVPYAKEVPGSDGSLLWLDLRDWGWNADAWQAVAERELYVVEPAIDHGTAEYLRQKLGATLSKEALKGRTIAAGNGTTRTEPILPAVFMVSGDQFVRDTLETNRVPSYYDLLFSRFRFKDGRQPIVSEIKGVQTVRKYVDHKGGDFIHPVTRQVTPNVKAGKYYYDVQEIYNKLEYSKGQQAKFQNFPANLTDWERAFGIDRTLDFGKESFIDLDFGAIVEGGNDQPKFGSFVTLQNRLIRVLSGPLGGHLETFDVLETTGPRDYTEALIFGGKVFKKGNGAVAVRDAGEILSYLKNGAQAGLLIDKNENRVEVAGNNVAFDQGSTTMRKDVRDMGSCLVCHAPSGGYIEPKNKVTDAKFNELVALKFKDPVKRNRVQGYFREQSYAVKGFQDGYLKFIAETTGYNDLGKPWTGIQFSKEVETFRREYDNALTLEQCASICGMPPQELTRLLVKLPFTRAGVLARGGTVPRRTFEVDLYPNIAILRALEVSKGQGNVKQVDN